MVVKEPLQPNIIKLVACCLMNCCIYVIVHLILALCLVVSKQQLIGSALNDEIG